MIVVGCAGFPVPATRFFKEFSFVEIQETHLAIPGIGTVRRWKREAPPGFEFAMLAPREIGQEGFKEGKVTETALKNVLSTGGELGATTAVFVAPTDFPTGRTSKGAVKEFLVSVRKKFDRVVWEAPLTWDVKDADSVAGDSGAIIARDPLTQGLSKAAVAYYRLPGPAGHKSRYEDPAIEKLAALAKTATHHTVVHYVFTNVDMFADAKRFKKLMKLP
ncbi:DUF72 domain-containing protein [soil metagenome]